MENTEKTAGSGVPNIDSKLYGSSDLIINNEKIITHSFKLRKFTLQIFDLVFVSLQVSSEFFVFSS